MHFVVIISCIYYCTFSYKIDSTFTWSVWPLPGGYEGLNSALWAGKVIGDRPSASGIYNQEPLEGTKGSQMEHMCPCKGYRNMSAKRFLSYEKGRGDWPGMGLWIFKSRSQWYTYFNKAMPPSPFQIGPLSGNQIFKYRCLWGHSSHSCGWCNPKVLICQLLDTAMTHQVSAMLECRSERVGK